MQNVCFFKVCARVAGCPLPSPALGKGKPGRIFQTRPPWPHGGARVNALTWASRRLPLRKSQKQRWRRRTTSVSGEALLDDSCLGGSDSGWLPRVFQNCVGAGPKGFPSLPKHFPSAVAWGTGYLPLLPPGRGCEVGWRRMELINEIYR